MGRGDKKTKKGKRFSSSYGRLRPRKGKREIFVIKEKKVETVEQEQEEVLTKKSPAKKKTKAKKATKKNS